MRYLGGKSKLASRIVDKLPLASSDVVWEPFMGGAAVTTELLRRKTSDQTLVCTDNHVALVHLWQRVKAGWEPADLGGVPLSDELYAEARALPDTDPYKAFIGFGCSFGGKWFGGNAKSAGRNHYAESRRNLLNTAEFLRSANNVQISIASFFDVLPVALKSRLLIYCDPPYADTEGYTTGDFDSSAFWCTCVSWARLGARVFVSEFFCPVKHSELLSISRKITVAIGTGAATKADKLFEVLP